jgi:hypothetical protein
MARYKVVDKSPRLLPVDLEAQLIPDSFAHAPCGSRRRRAGPVAVRCALP